MTSNPVPSRFAVLRASGQPWKFWLSATLLLVAGVAALVQRFGPAESRFVASASGTVAFIVALALYLSIRCPACKRSLGYWSLSKPVGSVDFASPATVGTCPMCGYKPGDDGAQRR
jgi:predicted lysophospholipase L1 biosynthesis ABC-type transport system permease subunit